jgi:hypothetical protein
MNGTKRRRACQRGEGEKADLAVRCVMAGFERAAQRSLMLRCKIIGFCRAGGRAAG